MTNVIRNAAAAILLTLLTTQVLAQATGAAPAEAPDVLEPAPNLHVDGMPPVPASVAASVGRYTEFRTANFAGWHPTRREALVLTRFADTDQVHRSPDAGRRASPAHLLPRAHHERRLAATHGRLLRLHARSGGDEFWQLFRSDVATGARRWSATAADLELARPLVKRGRSDGIRIDASQRRRP